MKPSNPSIAIALFAFCGLVTPAQAADPPAWNRALIGARIVESMPGVPGHYDVIGQMLVGRGEGDAPLNLGVRLEIWIPGDANPSGANEVPVQYEASPAACSTTACANGWQCASLNVDGVPLIGNCNLVFPPSNGPWCLCTGTSEVIVAQQLQLVPGSQVRLELMPAPGALPELYTEDDSFPAFVPPSGVQSYCYGELDSLCPCGNSAAPGQGCRNSTGQGAALHAVGTTSIAADDLLFVGEMMPPNTPVLLFYGEDPVGPIPFGDGLRCAGTNVVRIGTKITDGWGVAQWGSGLAGSLGWSPGDVIFAQDWYRDPAGPCGSGFNLSNGLKIEFSN